MSIGWGDESPWAIHWNWGDTSSMSMFILTTLGYLGVCMVYIQVVMEVSSKFNQKQNACST
jgi:hypothetical protein